MKKYYEVVAKCGHVGKNHYYEGLFFETAESGKEAAYIVRGRGRVKHDHKDAIISVREITREEFLTGRKNKANNPYFQCVNVQQQNMLWDNIVGGIKEETHSTRFDYDEDYQKKRKSVVSYKQNKLKQKMKSYIDYEAYAI